MFDSHAHVAAEEFDIDRAEVIARLRSGGLSGWIEVGTTLEESKKAVVLAQQEEGVYATVGVHPNDIQSLQDEGWKMIEELVTQPRVVAIGEVGFDFYRGGTKENQEPALRKFIALSQQHTLPIVFHVRDGEGQGAHEALLQLLQSYGSDCPRGVIHTYSGTLEQAQRYLSLGMFLSFSGVVTFKKAEQLVEVAKMVPAERMLIETDCPFLTPEPYRGKRNEPLYVQLVAQKLTTVRGVSVEEIEKQTDQNAKTLFGI